MHSKATHRDLIQVYYNNHWITVPMCRMERDGVWAVIDGKNFYFSNENVGLIW